ncbi:MAG: thermonuclease family protein [Dehalococcoidia bacterium]
MQEMPRFYSRSGTRTRPGRRRTAPPSIPDLRRASRRLSRSFVTIAAFIAIVGAGSAALARGRSATDAPIAASAPAGAVPVDVARVIDGDTIDVQSAATALRVRLYGVNAPERGQPCADEATQRLEALAGTRVLLLPDARQTDPYGRELRYVFTSNGRSIDETLVREGLARAWRDDGSRRAALIDAEDQARASRTGCLWGGAPAR